MKLSYLAIPFILTACTTFKSEVAGVQMLSKLEVEPSRTIASQSPDSYRERLASRVQSISGCYTRAMARTKKIDRVVLRLMFDVTDGEISNFKVRGNTFDDQLEGCVEDQVKIGFTGFNTDGKPVSVIQPFNLYPNDNGKLDETKLHYSEGIIQSNIVNKHFVVFFPMKKIKADQYFPKSCETTKAGLTCKLFSSYECDLAQGEQVFLLGMFVNKIYTYGKNRDVNPHVEIYSMVSDKKCSLNH